MDSITIELGDTMVDPELIDVSVVAEELAAD